MLRSVAERRMHAWQALVLACGAAALTWGLLSFAKAHGPFYVSGPYHVPLTAERFVGGVALIGSVAVVVELLRSPPKAVRGISVGATAVLFLTSALVTFLWRLHTGRGEGANIGAGMALMSGPVVVAGLLCACVAVEKSLGGVRPGFLWWIAAALLTGPIGLVVLFLV